jgi:hypothetical protein
MFKRIISFIAVLALSSAMSAGACAEYAPELDYMELMLDAAAAGDVSAGIEAQRSRDEKLVGLGLEFEQVDFDELYLLARLIHAEAGSAWLPEKWRMAVGEVALNRVASPEFPDTLAEVIEQPGQYYGRGNRYFEKLVPSRECAEAAARLLSGERVLCEPSVVFQANFILGSGVFLELEDSALGSTYLCYSSHPELYEG